MKRVFIVHGWGNSPDDAWAPWIKRRLEVQGVEVYALKMPNTNNPKIETWVNFLAEKIGTPDKDTFLIGHSIGVQAIMRYLETINTTIGGVVFVAGFFTLTDQTFKNEEERKLIDPWLNTPIDIEKVKQNAGKIIAIFSDNDPCVGNDNVKLFQERLNAETVIVKNKGHMGAGDNYLMIPEIDNSIDEILSLKFKNLRKYPKLTRQEYNEMKTKDPMAAYRYKFVFHIYRYFYAYIMLYIFGLVLFLLSGVFPILLPFVFLLIFITTYLLSFQSYKLKLLNRDFELNKDYNLFSHFPYFFWRYNIFFIVIFGLGFFVLYHIFVAPINKESLIWLIFYVFVIFVWYKLTRYRLKK